MSPPPLPHTPSINSLRSQGETSPSLPAGFRNNNDDDNNDDKTHNNDNTVI